MCCQEIKSMTLVFSLVKCWGRWNDKKIKFLEKGLRVLFSSSSCHVPPAQCCACQPLFHVFSCYVQSGRGCVRVCLYVVLCEIVSTGGGKHQTHGIDTAPNEYIIQNQFPLISRRTMFLFFCKSHKALRNTLV